MLTVGKLIILVPQSLFPEENVRFANFSMCITTFFIIWEPYFNDHVYANQLM